MGVCNAQVTFARRHQQGHYEMEKRWQEDWKFGTILSVGMSGIHIWDNKFSVYTHSFAVVRNKL